MGSTVGDGRGMHVGDNQRSRHASSDRACNPFQEAMGGACMQREIRGGDMQAVTGHANDSSKLWEGHACRGQSEGPTYKQWQSAMQSWQQHPPRRLNVLQVGDGREGHAVQW